MEPLELARGLFEKDVLVALSPLDGAESDLLPAERRICARFGEVRLREFATGRRCARELLRRLGEPDAPLVRDDRGMPLWPPGVVGSISHKKDLCLVAVASARRVSALGVDVEDARPLGSELWRRICTSRELRWLATRPEAERGVWAKLLFSAKESSYKAWSSWKRDPLRPRDLEIAMDPERGEFSPSRGLLSTAPTREFTGRFRRGSGWLMTALVLPAPGS